MRASVALARSDQLAPEAVHHPKKGKRRQTEKPDATLEKNP